MIESFSSRSVTLQVRSAMPIMEDIRYLFPANAANRLTVSAYDGPSSAKPRTGGSIFAGPTLRSLAVHNSLLTRRPILPIATPGRASVAAMVQGRGAAQVESHASLPQDRRSLPRDRAQSTKKRLRMGGSFDVV